MAFESLNPYDINSTMMQELQCKSYCAQQFVNEQYNAMGNIYGRFGKYLLAMSLFFIIYSILDKVEYAGEKKKFKFLSKEYDFNINDDLIKYIKLIKNIFFATMFAMSLIYYFMSKLFFEMPV